MGCGLYVAEVCMKRSGGVRPHHIQSLLLPLLLEEGAQKRSEVRQDHGQTIGVQGAESNHPEIRGKETGMVWEEGPPGSSQEIWAQICSTYRINDK